MLPALLRDLEGGVWAVWNYGLASPRLSEQGQVTTGLSLEECTLQLVVVLPTAVLKAPTCLWSPQAQFI